MIYLSLILTLLALTIITGIIQTIKLERNEKAKRSYRRLQRSIRLEL